VRFCFILVGLSVFQLCLHSFLTVVCSFLYLCTMSLHACVLIEGIVLQKQVYIVNLLP